MRQEKQSLRPAPLPVLPPYAEKTYLQCRFRAKARHRLLSQVYFWHTFAFAGFKSISCNNGKKGTHMQAYTYIYILAQKHANKIHMQNTKSIHITGKIQVLPLV